MIDSDPIGLSTWLATRLNEYNLAYLHVMRGDFYRQQSGDVMTSVLIAGGYLKVSFFSPFYGAYIVFDLDQKDTVRFRDQP